MRRVLGILAGLFLAVAPAMAQEDTARFGTGGTEVLFRSTTDIEIIRPVIERFADLNPDVTIVYEQWGSNALFAQSRADCSGDGPSADAVLSSAVQQMVWLVNAACAVPHRSAATLSLPDARRWRDELWGITAEPAVIAYNTKAFAGRGVPRSRFALIDAVRADPDLFRSRIATYDITASGLGYLFAFSDSLEATTFGALLESFARIDAVATCCSAEIIEGVAEGRYLIAYNVLGSYVASAARPEVGMILPEDYTLVLSRAFMVPKGARQKDTATALLDFLLGVEAQFLLGKAGLVNSVEPAENALAPSVRRSIALSPSLLVSLDANRRAQFLAFWEDTFRIDPLP